MNIMVNDEALEREDEKSKLLEFSNNIAGVRDKTTLTKTIIDGLNSLFSIDRYMLSAKTMDQNAEEYILFDLKFTGNKTTDLADHISKFKIDPKIAKVIFDSTDPIMLDIEELLHQDRISESSAALWESISGTRTILAVPLRAGIENIGILWLHPDMQVNERLLKGVASQIALAVANNIANEKISKHYIEITEYKQRLEQENLHLQEEMQITNNYSEIIGNSGSMKDVFRLVSQVSESQSSVLILGETGTGKELVARAIHNASPRKDKLMVKVNCAALPPNLIESILFGHEKGSFTGAIERRVGKFELANRSTLFLDEIGELPLEMQVKLLRVLQEKEFERIGGKSVIKSDVRIIAATNRNLLKEVEKGNFRSDLYFRLDVFPITIPPLRERKEDIPLLACHFLRKYAIKGSRASSFSNRAMKELIAYNWPGNVRELEHTIERSVLLSNNSMVSSIGLPSELVNENVIMESEIKLQTLEENERAHIIKALKVCKGKVSGIGGAAILLNLPSTTLHARIKKLNIKKRHI
ncbi:sigma 54-interacting transcriptional regulator [Dyadobacter sp. UP-52]|uniref:Sigma 54-interacting transcriptional regulator n=2 Tax=Dyadobacter subterraneus TaxID=2773304 RepID=A0ABR9W764_9BACT|nr:sigma 54-interacting transcriptional regulator [Dyadobacter subterraneus]